MVPAFTAGIFLLAGLMLAGAETVRAGVGSAVSGLTTVDTRLPELTITVDPVGDLFQAGQGFEATVTATDDHPGATPADHYLVAWVDTTPVDTLLFDPLDDPAIVDWHAPEVASAHVRLTAYSRDLFGNVGQATTGEFTVIPSVTDVPAGPARFLLGPGHPNPFNPMVHFAVELPAEGHLRMTVFDARGRRVKILTDGPRAAGAHRITWNGTAEGDRRLPGGTYLVASEYRHGDLVERRNRKVLLLP